MTKSESSPCSDSIEDQNQFRKNVDPSLLPLKRCYRQRAHCNPFSDHDLVYPLKPDLMDWNQLYPVASVGGDNSVDSKVRFVDVGCGYGGLLFALSQRYPKIRSLGLEIRLKVSDYVQEKIKALRIKHSGSYQNIACIRTNAMKFLPNYFNKGQLHKLFFLYPDPHFKRVKHKWRIISPTLLDTYAYFLSPNSRLYTATDVPDLALWNIDCLSNHALFKPICLIYLKPNLEKKLDQSDDFLGEFTLATDLFEKYSYLIRNLEELHGCVQSDPILGLLTKGCTEESAKATREGRQSIITVFERLPNPDWL